MWPSYNTEFYSSHVGGGVDMDTTLFYSSSLLGILSILLNGLQGGTVVTILDMVESLLWAERPSEGSDL